VAVTELPFSGAHISLESLSVERGEDGKIRYQNRQLSASGSTSINARLHTGADRDN